MSHDNRRWLLFGAISLGIMALIVGFVVPKLIPEPKPVPLSVPTVFSYDLFLDDLNAYDSMMEQVASDDDQTVDPDEVERQIVSINAPATVEVPEEARFEDRVNRSVDEETVARNRSDTGGLGITTGDETLRNALVEEEQDENQQGQTDNDETETDSAEEQEEQTDEVAAIWEDPNGPAEYGGSDTDTESPDPNDNDAASDDFDLSAFNPTMALASDFIGVPGDSGVDYLDLPQGDRTQLNSLENLYWSFWDRIKNQVRDHWQPSHVYRDRDPTGRVFGVEDRYTVLNVTLNGDGSLRHLNVDRSCGLDFLDREAMRAIREAEPFRNIPEALKDDAGLLRFRFGFYFEVNSSSFRIRREDW